MKKAKLVYNPVAGKKVFAAKLDSVIANFQSNGWKLVPYRTTGNEDGSTFSKMFLEDTYNAIIVAGGDGTVHHVVNGLLGANLSTPLGIFPVGTANDFAVHLNLPQDVEECCRTIIAENVTEVDVGLANGTYFINVASAGLLTDIPHKTDVAMKNVLGKLAYYLKGIETIPNFRPIPVEIICNNKVFCEEVLLFIIANGSAAGGFSRLAPRADIVDGFFDMMVIKPVNLGQLLSLFLKLIRGEHINDPRVEYFQTSHVIISCTQEVDTDLDGEPGSGFPLEVKVIPRRLPVFT